ncbi:uncharacterized protein LOC129767671 isoform X3 [Toxorhynchites rutilus septentrionalis]|uniref:uncharacterized protein LOC129767671 isoform X3 n=1 Tax=Toxorhynchites rutilus septentrionalis TaxID=329112 RepID=UPI00247B28E0|nr:uncharacterized protein LOC129767671 isoform X3 [Toxorhynchites rutilus septentrionalis]
MDLFSSISIIPEFTRCDSMPNWLYPADTKCSSMFNFFSPGWSVLYEESIKRSCLTGFGVVPANQLITLFLCTTWLYQINLYVWQHWLCLLWASQILGFQQTPTPYEVYHVQILTGHGRCSKETHKHLVF